MERGCFWGSDGGWDGGTWVFEQMIRCAFAVKGERASQEVQGRGNGVKVEQVGTMAFSCRKSVPWVVH